MTSPVAAAPFHAPHLAYGKLSPLLIVFGVALAGVLVEAFLPRDWRYRAQVVLSLGGLVVAFAAVILVAGNSTELAGGAARGSIEAQGAIAIDGPTLFMWGALLVLSLISVMLCAERELEGGVMAFAGQASAPPGTEAERAAAGKGIEQTEVFPLVMFAVAGMMLFPAANDLITMFVGLEVLSLPLYLLCGLARRRRLISQEAALKYFLLGAFSSAFFVYGIGLLYGFAGGFRFADIDAAISNREGAEPLLLVGIALLAVGMLFKIGAVPFHGWTPDVYQGAPTAITAFMSACTKLAAFGALLRVFYVGLGGARWDWQPMIWIIAIITMAFGSIVALTQTDVKRMLAYSSVAHAGFLLTGFVGAHEAARAASGAQITSLQSVLFYLVSYGFASIGAFAIVMLVRDAGGETTHLSRWAGLGKEAPVVAGVFAFFLLAFAGIPTTSGFTGKWAVFTSAWESGAWPLVIVAVLMSAVAAFFYVRVIVVMFFSDPVGDGPSVVIPGFLTTAVITVGAAATLLLGIVPGPLLDLTQHAGEFLR